VKITADEVKRIGLLSRLKLTEEEIELFREQLSSILTYMDKLNELNTENVEPTSHVIPLKNVFRDDCVKESLDRDELLLNVPAKKDGFYKVPKIID